jgi:hypothetical protein
MESSLRAAQRRSNPENEERSTALGLLRFARNDGPRRDNNFQAGRNKNQTGRNENQIGRNKTQASRNKIQMALSSNKRDFSIS